MAGRITSIPPATERMASSTNTAAPSESVIAFSVHAKVRIIIAGTMALKPSGMQSMHSLNPSTLRLTYSAIVIISANALPTARPTDASLLENAVTKFSPAKNPPVQIIPMTQQTIRARIGITRSFTVPFPTTVSSSPSPYGRSGVVNRSPFFALSSCTFIEPKSMFRIAIVTIITIVSNA